MPTDEELKLAVKVLGLFSTKLGKATLKAVKSQLVIDIGLYVTIFDLRDVVEGLCEAKFLNKIQTTGRDGKPEIQYQITVEGYSRYDQLSRYARQRKQKR